VYDTEESPLSMMEAARFTSGVREGRLCNRNEPHQSSTVNPKGRGCLNRGWNEHPRWSKSKQSRSSSVGTGRMLS
jgi:hypothetical protein